MRTAETSDGFGRAPGGEEVRCPSCSRLLILRSGPAIRPHFAHRPRQSCRRRPGRSGISPLRLEQLTLFDAADLAPAEPEPVPELEPRSAPNRRRRRRRAWLPRLIRWIKGQPQPWAVRPSEW